jgi:hypothetical protein
LFFRIEKNHPGIVFARDYASRDQSYHFIHLTLRFFSRNTTVRTRTSSPGTGSHVTGSALVVLSRTSGSYNLIIFYKLALSLVICTFPAILCSWGAPSIITFLTKVCCFRICSRLLCSTPSSLSRPRSHWGISTKKPKSQMNEKPVKGLVHRK